MIKRFFPLTLIFLISCSDLNISNTNINEQLLSSQSKSDLYPFDINKDFFPLYENSYWKYDIYDSSKNLLSTLTKILTYQKGESITLDSRNKYYISSFYKSYSNPQSVKDKDGFDFIRRRENKLAFGKVDSINYYPQGIKNNSLIDLNAFRPFINFDKSKTEKITVKAGTFDCVKARFDIVPLDSYTVWYAKGIGEIKRVRDGSGIYNFTYELSEYSLGEKKFFIKNEKMDFNSLPKTLIEKANLMKNDYIKLNQLPENLFDIKSDSSIFVDKYAIKDNVTKNYEIYFQNKSLNSKDNINLLINVDLEFNIKSISVNGENNNKPTYKGKIVDKLPTLVKQKH